MRPAALGAGRLGFTLVEVVVALTVLTVGLLGLSATVGVVASRMNSSLLETRVTACALAQLEGLLAYGAERPGSGGCGYGDLEVSRGVGVQDLQEVRVVVRGRLAGSEVADTLITLVRLR